MASAGDGGDIGEAAEATRPTRNKRTIYDYLGEGDDSEEVSPPSPETPPPRLRLPMFTCATIRFGRLGRKRGERGGRKEAAAAEKSEDASVDSSGSKQPAAGTSSGGGSVAGGQTVMGLSMLFLLAKTCVELNRMAEVRAQMETLLREVRDEASRVKGGAAADHVVIVTPKACNNRQSSSSSTTTATASSSSCVSDDTSTTHCLETRRGEDGERASSEAEVETEPPAARRHQPPECRCDTEQDTPDQCCWDQSSSDDDGEFIELEGGRFGTGEENSQRGGAAVVDESDDDDVESCERRHEGGVSATELERRLHVLQHRRDRERIDALESALRRAQRKLTEKEMEARLWQDTATMALGQPMPRWPAGRTVSHHQ